MRCQIIGIHLPELFRRDFEYFKPGEKESAFFAKELVKPLLPDDFRSIVGNEISESTLIEDDALSLHDFKCAHGCRGIHLLVHGIFPYARYAALDLILTRQDSVADLVGESYVYRSVVCLYHPSRLFLHECLHNLGITESPIGENPAAGIEENQQRKDNPQFSFGSVCHHFF